MRILVVGAGGREHVIAWKLTQSHKVGRVYVAPGNTGTAQIAQNLNIQQNDIPGLIKAVESNSIDLTVVGSEGPLAEGIVDLFQAAGLRIFGPTRAAAEIESSKVFAKDLMQKYDIPCARSASFDNPCEARNYIKESGGPLVIKANGLAAGKGVIMAKTTRRALDALFEIMGKKVLGAAGKKVVIEEWLAGKEMSAFAITDGKAILLFEPACDYKKVYDGDRGPNTGGMGSYSPPYFLTGTLIKKVRDTIMKPALGAMFQEGRPYQGVLYGGLIVARARPKTLEFNCRFGDPETQVILPRLKTDLAAIIMAATEGMLYKIEAEWTNAVCVGIVMASQGYPGTPITGREITGLNDVDKDIMVFHSGTKLKNGKVVTSGGRVLTVVALGKTYQAARKEAYDNVKRIHFEGCHYRKDIALF